MATVSRKDLAKIEADKKAAIAAKEAGKEKAYQTQLRQAPEGYRNNPEFQAALKNVVYNNDAVLGGNKSIAVPLKEKLNAIVAQLDPYPNSQKTSDPRIKQAYGNAYAQKLVNVEGSGLSKESTALNEASKAVGLPTDFAQNLEYDILGQPNTSGGGMGFFSSIGKTLALGMTKPLGKVISSVGEATGLPTATKLGDALQDPTLKGLTRAIIPVSGGIKSTLESAEDMAKVAAVAAAIYGGGAALGSLGAGGAGAAGAGAGAAGAGAGSTVLGSQTLGSLASSLGLGGVANSAPSVLSSLGLSGLGAGAAGTAAGGASPYFVGGAIPYTGGALGASAPTLLGSSTLAGLANSLGLSSLVDAAPSVLSSLGLGGTGSTALGSGVLNNLLGGGAAGGQGGSSGLFGKGLSLQDLLVGGGTAAGAYYASEAANKVAQQQAQAAQQGIDIVKGAADRGINTLQTSADKAATFQQPFYGAGQNALTRLQKILGLGGQAPDFTEITKNPAYQFRLQQGNNAVQNSAANAGNLFSGQTGKALTDYSQDLASTEYQNIINNLSGEATRGQNAGNQLSNIFQNTGVNQSNVGIQTGSAIADLLRTKGDAVASGPVGRTNAITGGVENLTKYLTRPVQYA
jgi:hypothetical protein